MIELRRRDFSDDCSTVSVERGVTHSGGKCYIATPKDSRPAKVAIPPHIRGTVIDHLSKHVGSEGDSLLFLHCGVNAVTLMIAYLVKRY